MPAIRSDVFKRGRARSRPPWLPSRPITPDWPHRNDTTYNLNLNVPPDMERLGSYVDSEVISYSASLKDSVIENNNSNWNVLRGPGNIVNNNPNVYAGPGASLHYAPVNNFYTPAPDPSDEIQIKIAAALKDRYVPEAVYAAQPDGGCMNGTRVQVLRDIDNWIRSLEGQKIFWLAGMAGMGKTTIAQTICLHIREIAGIALGGSFFCSRSTGSAGQHDVLRIIPTLARLLAQQSTKFSEALAAELKRDPEIPNHRISEQVRHLLGKPLLALRDSHVPIIFVIDALDECGGQPNADEMTNNTESHRIVSEMLQVLVDFSRSSGTLPVKFLITSRPETHIRDTPVSDATFTNILHLHTVNEQQVAADIRLYISTRLSSTPKLRTWFTDEHVDMLARLCGGLFIVAATALNHILGGGFDAAATRFRTLLNSTQEGLSSRAAAPLDLTYRFILEDAANAGQTEAGDLQVMQQLLASLLSARMSLSVAALAELIGMNQEDVRATLSRLHAVVYVPYDDNEPRLRTLHASFGDYLIGRASTSIRISDSLGHEVLARGCLRVMAERLHFNISQSRSSYESNTAMPPHSIPLYLEYACMQWIHHVAGLPDASALYGDIYDIFRPRFLFWLEVMSVLHEVWRAAAMLFFAAGIVRSSTLARFLRDANAFVASSREAIERSAPHIYLSALPFTAKNSLIYQTFYPLCTGLISVETFGIDRHGGRLLMTLIGHEKDVRSIAYSSEGHRLVSGSRDGTVRIWNAHTGEEMMTLLRSGDGEVWSVAFSPNDKGVAAGTEGGVVCMWNILTGQAHVRRLTGHSDIVRYVALSSDGGLLASASADMSVRLWNTETGVETACLNGHTNAVNAVSFSPDGATLASGSDDCTIRMWHVASGEPAGQQLPSGGPALSVCFSPDGGTLASGGTRGTVQLWDLQTRTVFSTLRGHLGSILCVRFSPDGRSVVSASHDSTMRIWTVSQDTADVSSTSVVLKGHTKFVYSASFSPDGLYIASAAQDRTIRIWNAGSDQKVIQPLPAHVKDIQSAAVSSCGSFIVSGSSDCSVRVWDMQTGDPRLEPLLGHTDSVYAVTISSDGRLIASASAYRTICLWDARTGKAVGDPLTAHEGSVNAVTFSADTRWLASGSVDQTVRIWDVATRQPSSNIAPLRCNGLVFTVAFSPNGRLLAAGDGSGRIYLWHANTGQSVCNPLRTNNHVISSIAFSADGARIVASGDDNMARVWDSDTRQQLLLLEGHSAGVYSVVFSSDGELICSGSKDRTVRLWSAATGAPIATMHGHTHNVRSVAFTPDGRSVVSCSADSVIRVWDVDAARRLLSTSASDPATAIASATLTYDGWLVSSSRELLGWIPEEYRSYLQLSPPSPCTMIIGRRRIAVTIGDDSLRCGTNWTSCWRRGKLSPAPR